MKRGSGGLIHATLLDGRGGGSPVDWEQVRSWSSETEKPLWIHLERPHLEAQGWIKTELAHEPFVRDALLADEARPRAMVSGRGLLLILRGANFNPGYTPDDMISLRMWTESNRVISVRHRQLKAAEDVRSSLERGAGPTTAAGLLVQLVAGLCDRTEPVILNLDALLDDLEEEILSHPIASLRGRLAELRRQIVRMRRHLLPQRDALLRLLIEPPDWLEPRHKANLRESSDRVTRFVEDLDECRERAGVTQDELTNRQNELIGKRTYVMSIMAAIFLPLGLITGLLGINVGGMPGADSAWAFWQVCVMLVLITGFEVWLFRRLKWL